VRIATVEVDVKISIQHSHSFICFGYRNLIRKMKKKIIDFKPSKNCKTGMLNWTIYSVSSFPSCKSFLNT
jgi:hypothetical protein